MEGRLEKPSDILTVAEAINLINSDTREKPVVDIAKLIRNIEYLEANWRGSGMNYTIFLIKRDKSGKIVPNGIKYAAVTNSREKDELKYAITDKYKELSGREINPDEIGLTQQTTMVDDNNKSAAPRRNTAGKKLKLGDNLITGEGEATGKDV